MYKLNYIYTVNQTVSETVSVMAQKTFFSLPLKNEVIYDYSLLSCGDSLQCKTFGLQNIKRISKSNTSGLDRHDVCSRWLFTMSC